VGSFVGFAPVNNPALTIAVILDSAKGLHQGGQVSAPVFNRIMQQALEYLNVPHDAEIKADPKRQLLLAEVKDSDLEDSGALDREGPGPDFSEADTTAKTSSAPVVAKNTDKSSATGVGARIMPTALAAAPETAGSVLPTPVNDAPMAAGQTAQGGGPVSVDVGSGMVVPSFLGKSLRAVTEIAQHDGLEVSLVGSGIARDQSPAPGARIAPGERVTVRFAR
jgi:cell division protein FtsI (penicillin-binding protein 3)